MHDLRTCWLMDIQPHGNKANSFVAVAFRIWFAKSNAEAQYSGTRCHTVVKNASWWKTNAHRCRATEKDESDTSLREQPLRNRGNPNVQYEYLAREKADRKAGRAFTGNPSVQARGQLISVIYKPCGLGISEKQQTTDQCYVNSFAATLTGLIFLSATA